MEKYLEKLNDLEHGIEVISKGRVSFIKAVLRKGIISSEAVIRWCDETIEDLQYS